MKHVRTLLIASLLSSLMLSAHAQKDRTLSNGFSIQFILGIPSPEYGLNRDATVEKEYQFSTLVGLQLGNRWYFKKWDQIGVGLMVNWFDISSAIATYEILGTKVGRITVDATFLEFGPIGTYAINSTMAIDAYYNLRPMGLATVEFDMDGNLIDEIYGSGFTHTLGAAFRWKVLSVGVESVLGSIKDLNEKDLKFQAKNFRFVLGVKF